jgi:ABC-2 type transport system ATP-binding protein
LEGPTDESSVGEQAQETGFNGVTSAAKVVLSIRDLTKFYGRNRGVAGVSFDVHAGEILGFLGPNGSGKTTTLRCIPGFLRADSGVVEILDHDVRTDAMAVHRSIGNMPGEFSLEDRMTGRQLLDLFARLRGLERIPPFADDLADRLDADLDRPMRQLSRGNKQKIGIIQALFHRPPLLILDEPTGGLDPLKRDEFLTLLREASGAGQAVLFSSHNLAEVERVADRVGVIRAGQLVAVDAPNRIAGREVRTVRIELRRPAAGDVESAIRALPNVEDVQIDPELITLRSTGPMDDLMKTVARLDVGSFESERPSLDEIFQRFYSDDLQP